MNMVFRWGDPMEKGNLEDLVIDGTVILKCILGSRIGTWSGSVCRRGGTGGGLVYMR